MCCFAVTFCTLYKCFSDKQKDEASVSDKLKLKWQPLKQTGSRPSARSSCSLVVTAPNSAMIFGGVIDEVQPCYYIVL